MNESDHFKAMHEAVESESRETQPAPQEKSPRSMRLAKMMRDAVEHPDNESKSADAAAEPATTEKGWYTRWEEAKEAAEEKRRHESENKEH